MKKVRLMQLGIGKVFKIHNYKGTYRKTNVPSRIIDETRDVDGTLCIHETGYACHVPNGAKVEIE